MFRYLGFVWDTSRGASHSAAEALTRCVEKLGDGWGKVLDCPGLRVFCAGSGEGSLQAYPLIGSSGVVLGAVFDHPGTDFPEKAPVKATFDEQESRVILESRGARLVTDFWGNYVAFLRERDTGLRLVLKDPCGTLPCYFTSHGPIKVFFSSIEDCLQLGLRFTINPEFLQFRMTAFQNYNGISPLNEVQHVLRGEAIHITRRDGDDLHTIRRVLWSPLQFPEQPNLYGGPQHSAMAIRAVTRACTHAWASEHAAVVARLSGGLDSSVVVGCLAQTSPVPRIVTYTYYNPHGRSDERSWALMASQHSHTEHIERPLDPAQCRLEGLVNMQPSVAPVWGLQYLERTPLEDAIARERGATAVFTGEGGDSGFCSDSYAHAATDYLIHNGLRPRVVSIAAQIARRSELTVWRVLTRSIWRWLRGDGPHDGPKSMLEACKLVNSEVVKGALRETRPHPWFQSSQSVLQQTTLRLGGLIDMPEFYDPSRPASESLPIVISPLYSQPVLETLLRIPLYIHFYEGRERGLARLAFKDEVPEAILRRQWKDRAPGFFDELVRRNLPFLREMLLDGVLMQQNLLDRPSVEDALSTSQSRAPYLPAEIMKHLDTELWTRHWTSSSRQLVQVTA